MMHTGPALTKPAARPAKVSTHSAVDSCGVLLPARVKRRRILASSRAMEVAVPDAVKGRVEDVLRLTACSKLSEPIQLTVQYLFFY